MRVGIDIGGTKSHAIVLADGEIVDEIVTASRGGEDGVVHGTVDLLRELAERRGGPLTSHTFESVGIGIPGTVDVASGVITHAVNLGIVGAGLPLRDRLRELLGIGIAVENDVKATALGAASALGLVAHDDVTYLNVGTGVAAATTFDDRLIRGVGGMAGEIGHLSMDPRGEICPCGQRGCLETVLGGASIERRLRVIDPRLRPSDLFSARASGPGLSAERERVVLALTHACTLLAITYGAHAIVLGGGVIRHVPGLVDAARLLLQHRAADSPFLAALAVADRLVEVPPAVPVAAIGAALSGVASEQRSQLFVGSRVE